MNTQDAFIIRPADIARLEREARVMQAEFCSRLFASLRDRLSRALHIGAAGARAAKL